MLSKWFGGTGRGETSRSRIAFERTGEHVPGCPKGIFTINPDGSDARRIRPTGECPRWSPDGRWIAFSEGTEDNSGLSSVFIMAPDGSHVRRITNHHDVSATPPCWSPDSKRLAYSLWLWHEKRYQLCLVEVGSKRWKHLLYTENEVYPVWSPFDKILISTQWDGGDLRLFEVDPNSQRVCEAAGFAGGDVEPVWTQDGTRVVFGRDGDLGVTDTASGQTQIVPTKGTAIQWAIAPDGRSVAYAAAEGGLEAGFEIFVIDLSSQSKQKLVSNPSAGDHDVHSRCMSWSPCL